MTWQAISIHAPREGSDSPLPYPNTGTAYISIHAPREGSDEGTTLIDLAGRQDFYPRSP